MNCLHIEAFLIANASGGIIWAAAFGIGGYFFGKLLLQLHHVPWSTLCRADWVRNDPVPRAAGCYATTAQFLRELREAMRQRASIREYH